MNLSNPPVPMESKYQAHLIRLDAGTEIRIGDFWQTWMGHLTRVDEVKDGQRVDENRSYYRVIGLSLINND